MNDEQWQQWKQTYGATMKPSEQPFDPAQGPPPDSPLEWIAAAGFDRAIRPPHASIPLSNAPIAKVANSGISGAAVVVVVWALKTFVGFEIPPEIASAIAVLLAFISGYLTPLKQRELNT
jgi:hypothetical protein